MNFVLYTVVAGGKDGAKGLLPGFSLGFGLGLGLRGLELGLDGLVGHLLRFELRSFLH